MKNILKITLTILVLACPASAAASSFGPQQLEEFAAAQAYWGIESQCTSVKQEMVAPGSLNAPGEEAVGRATVPAQPEPCWIGINEGMPPCVEKSVMYHEVGHLDGLQHSADPHSFMYPGGLETSEAFCVLEVEGGNIAYYIKRLDRTKHRCTTRTTKARRRECLELKRDLQSELWRTERTVQSYEVWMSERLR